MYVRCSKIPGLSYTKLLGCLPLDVSQPTALPSVHLSALRDNEAPESLSDQIYRSALYPTSAQVVGVFELT